MALTGSASSSSRRERILCSPLRAENYIALPPEEKFELEYVTGKSWSGYNWYKGNSHSLIQINTDLPIYIDRAVDLGSHEGYPGHHVYNTLLEMHLVRERGWIEFSVYALFSPQSLIAEGTANYGIEMVFPGELRVAFEHDTLFPLAGMDPKRAEEYYKVHALFQKLNYAGNEAARQYLNGSINRDNPLNRSRPRIKGPPILCVLARSEREREGDLRQTNNTGGSFPDF